MNTNLSQITAAIAMTAALVAAITDAKSGKIPNVLTFPILFLSPLILGAIGGLAAFTMSLSGAVISGFVPYVLYRVSNRVAIGGGDVKLFAALGTLVGPALGLEIEFASFVLLAAVAVTKLTFSGSLLRLFVSTGWVLVNPFLPKRLRRAPEHATLTEMRLGPAIFAGVLVVVVLERFGGARWFA